MARTAEFEVRKEAIWVVCNICTGGTDLQIKALISSGGITSLCNFLDQHDSKTVHDAVDAILGLGEKDDMSYDILFDENDGVEKLENLQYHVNEDIYEKAIELIEKYFGSEAEEEDENVAPIVNGNTFGFGVASPPNKQLFTNFPTPTRQALEDSNSQQFNFSSDFGNFRSAI